MTWFKDWKFTEKKSRTPPLWVEPQYKSKLHKFEGNFDLKAVVWEFLLWLSRLGTRLVSMRMWDVSLIPGLTQ